MADRNYSGQIRLAQNHDGCHVVESFRVLQSVHKHTTVAYGQGLSRVIYKFYCCYDERIDKVF